MSKSSPTSTPVRPQHQKSMSSRLLTMKFMQRAAASSPTASSPLAQSPAGDGPPLKRQRTENSSVGGAGGNEKGMSVFDVNALANQKAVQIAMATEEAKRQAALDKAAEEAGDTRWVLNFEDKTAKKEGGLRIEQMSFAGIDRAPRVVRTAEREEVDEPVVVGRRSFGKFNRKLEKLQDPEASSSESSDEEGDEDDGRKDYESDSDDSDSPESQLIKDQRKAQAAKLKEDRKAKKKAEKKELLKLAASRRNNEVNINGLSSLSGRDTSGSRSSGPCFQCGKEGHMASSCPEKGKKRGRQSMGGGGDYGERRDSKKGRKSY